MGVVQSFAGLPNVSRVAAKKQKADSLDKTGQASQNMKREGVLISVEDKGVSGNARAKRNNDPPRSLAAAA
jgi:hypothetical protein